MNDPSGPHPAGHGKYPSGGRLCRQATARDGATTARVGTTHARLPGTPLNGSRLCLAISAWRHSRLCLATADGTTRLGRASARTPGRRPSRRGFSPPGVPGRLCLRTEPPAYREVALFVEQEEPAAMGRPRGRLAVGHPDGYFPCPAGCCGRNPYSPGARLRNTRFQLG